MYVGAIFRTRSLPKIIEVVSRKTLDLTPALADGHLRLPVDSTFGLTEFAAALDRMTSNQLFGKIVLLGIE
jgi:NADPH2:quinone reductase